MACQRHTLALRVSSSLHAKRSSLMGCTTVSPLQIQSSRTFASRSPGVVQALSTGDKLPGGDIKLAYFDSESNMQEISVEQLTKGKKVIIFAVPGAFTPTCSTKHLPGFVEKADEFKGKGVDTIACISVNDAFVMEAWAKQVGTDGKVMMLADGSANFAKALGVELDLTDKGLGIRSRRYSMIVDDGVVKDLNVEEGGAFTVSSADELLSAL
ncbi:hypothetical protein WJX84_005400 [Apatococcus fuscideae]|uniref:Glutaredoxin-dependent peroxiredoxin n=1 Tax=Apatococcus fuscideae TaxID=2026836 RepID=A0AAW1SQ01_9CHLO